MKELKVWVIVFCVLFAVWPVWRAVSLWYMLHQVSVVFPSQPVPSLGAPLVSSVHDAVAVMQRDQQAQFDKIRADNLRRRGFLPVRPLRVGEVCVGGTVVVASTVGGVPTYTQVLQGGLRISCE